MGILLALVFFIPFVYIGYLMSMLDRFMADNSAAIKNEGINPAAVVLGNTSLAVQVGKILAKNEFKVVYLNEPFLLEPEGRFSYLYALSENDADNIVMCKIGRKVYGIDMMIGLCNDRRNEGMFISERICYLLSDGVTAQRVYQAAAQQTGVTP